MNDVLDEVLLAQLLRAPDGMTDEQLRSVSRHFTMGLVDRWTQQAAAKGWIEPAYPRHQPRWYATTQGRSHLDRIALRQHGIAGTGGDDV